MKDFINFINRVQIVYAEELRNNSMKKRLEQIINNFIENKYSKIKKQKYVTIDIQNSQMLVISEFEDELKKHYPERLI